MAAALGALALPALGDAGAATGAGSRAKAPLTRFVAHRKGLDVALLVGPHEIVASSTSSLVHCEGGGKERGSVTDRGWKGFRVRRDGEFHKASSEAFEGSGSYFMELRGRVHRNRVIGTYRSWEERLGEEEFFPRCGTRSPRGEEMRFVAHRVEGPPWRPGGR
jgi:hypothetical protein